MKKKILLYIQVPFMDVNLEFIKMVKEKYDLHILIELPLSQLNANIFSLNINLNKYEVITSYWNVAKEWDIEYLADFFTGCTAVNFVIYKPVKKLRNFYIAARAVLKFIRKHNFDHLHFDDFSARQAFILPFISVKKQLVLNIHDPVPHRGEFEWKRFLIRKLFYKYASYYVTFSEFSKKELEKNLAPTSKILVFNLLPYSVFKKFVPVTDEVPEKDRYITFLGRLSPYKGLDLLLGAIVDILKEFPRQKFLIAGRRTFGYVPDFEQLGAASESVVIIERHLTNKEISGFILKSKLVVCPYIEATQSGVVMTSYALNCPVLVTEIGGLPEYVRDNITGLIVREISKEGIVKKIKAFLSGSLYAEIHHNLKNGTYITGAKEKNMELIETIYN